MIIVVATSLEKSLFCCSEHHAGDRAERLTWLGNLAQLQALTSGLAG